MGLRRADLRDGEPTAGTDPVGALETAVAAHPVHDDPARDARVRAAVSAERLSREVARLERRAQGRSESLARRFDRVLDVLGAWGYLEGWTLTAPGEILARLYTETDLLVADALRAGLLDGLSAAETAAVVSCFTYERRGEDDVGAPPPRWPTRRVAERVGRVEDRWRTLAAAEDDAGLSATRPPDPGFTAYIAEWVSGDSLTDILEDDELAGGDFVRHVKQAIDLLRQIAVVAPDPTTRATATAAADACFRGVVAAASAAP